MLAKANGRVSLPSNACIRKIFYATQDYSVVQKLSNKQFAKMICRFDRLKTAHNKGQKSFMSNGKLIGHSHV